MCDNGCKQIVSYVSARKHVLGACPIFNGSTDQIKQINCFTMSNQKNQKKDRGEIMVLQDNANI
jgi:hypothetical protein